MDQLSAIGSGIRDIPGAVFVLVRRAPAGIIAAAEFLSVECIVWSRHVVLKHVSAGCTNPLLAQDLAHPACSLRLAHPHTQCTSWTQRLLPHLLQLSQLPTLQSGPLTVTAQAPHQ